MARARRGSNRASDPGRRRFLKGSIGLAAGAALLGPARRAWGVASPLIVEWEQYRRRKAEEAAISVSIKR